MFSKLVILLFYILASLNLQSPPICGPTCLFSLSRDDHPLTYIVCAWTPLNTCHQILRLIAVSCSGRVFIFVLRAGPINLSSRFLSLRHQELSPFLFIKFSLSIGIFHPTSSQFTFIHLGILLLSIIKSTIGF